MPQSVYRSILKLSYPMVVGQLAFASMTFIDTLLMGQLGVEVIAGGGLGAVVYQFFYIVGIGLLVATATLIAFAMGEQNREKIQGALLSGVVVVLVLFLVSALMLWFAKPVLLLLGQEVAVVDIAEQYLRVVVWALLPAFAFVLLRSLVLGVGDPAVILPISVVAAASNYPLSYALMTGMFGLPALGLDGIALGTCIVSFGMFFGLALMIYRKPVFKPYPFWKNWYLFDPKQLRETFSLGLPIAMAHAMEVGLFSAAALLIGGLGVTALAAHQVALQCATLSFMIPLGISQAVSVKVGELYGAKQVALTLVAAKGGLLLSSASAAIAAMIFWFAPELLVSLFFGDSSTDDYQLVLPLAAGILFVAALFQFVDAWQVILMGVLRGFKMGASPTIVTIISYWLVGFPSAYLLRDYLGAVGVWAGLGIGLAVSAIMLAVLFWLKLRRSTV